MSEESFEPDALGAGRFQAALIVRIDIRDRAVLNNAWAGGHGGAGWEAIEIGS